MRGGSFFLVGRGFVGVSIFDVDVPVTMSVDSELASESSDEDSEALDMSWSRKIVHLRHSYDL